ncbi:restriction endonuclease [Bacillus carboniphilus]|uniref:Restriction endonuclease n=1 Tax=Bacillus carboniphilus TaxID=86663 RepID=A0ABY9JQP1_9BACI|nr:restriction endonuclease [Bacillus carboniphilus]WLR41711.1 restriction endonuclease [Bacillus carboniphilus]
MRRKKYRKKKDVSLTKLVTIVVVAGTYLYTRSVSYTIYSGLSVIILSQMIKTLEQSRYEKKLRNSGIREIGKMNGYQFEYYLAALLKGLGYKVKVTQASNDLGADLIISKDGEKIVVQAKRYFNKVEIKAIQEIASA